MQPESFLMSIRIILADDHQIVREGLCSLLRCENDIEIVAQANNGETVIHLADKLLPDVIIMDISMPGVNGIEATRRIKGEYPQVKIIGLSMHSYRRFIIEIFKAGASGYLLKNCAFAELANAIRIVATGKNYISPSLMGDALIESYVQDFLISEPSSFSVLSPQHREVFNLFREGRDTEQIAAESQISSDEVENCLSRILQELNLDTLEELTKYAVREKLGPQEV